MTPSAVDIANLLYLYAERLDAGDLPGVAELFRHARIKTKEGAPTIGAEELLALFSASVKRYACGTPRTKHVVTNPIIEIDEATHRATARSNYTVLQSVDGLALQPIAAGRYHGCVRAHRRRVALFIPRLHAVRFRGRPEPPSESDSERAIGRLTRRPT